MVLLFNNKRIIWSFNAICWAIYFYSFIHYIYDIDFSRAFVYEKFGGRAEEKINCLTEDSHIHVSTKSEVKAILDAYVWIVINKKDN